jgi:hypothetical protein
MRTNSATLFRPERQQRTADAVPQLGIGIRGRLIDDARIIDQLQRAAPQEMPRRVEFLGRVSHYAAGNFQTIDLERVARTLRMLSDVRR